MEFLIQRTPLLNLLTRVESAIGSKPLMPQLGYFLLEAKSHQVIVTGTDLSLSLKGSVDAKILREGKIALPANAFTQLVRSLPAPMLHITLEESAALVEAGDSWFKLRGMHPHDFPAFPEMKEPLALTIDAPSLKRSLLEVSFAAQKDDNRYILAGVLFDIQSDKVQCVATDGKKLARSEVAIEQEENSRQGKFVIPLRGVEEIMRNLPKEGAIELLFTSERVTLCCPDMLVTIKLLAGEFPDFQPVIPQETAHLVGVDREELLSLLRQTTLFANESGLPVRFQLQQGELKIFANSKELGEGQVSMPAHYSGPHLHLAFNPQHLIEILKACGKERIQLCLNSRYDPTIITETAATMGFDRDASPLYLVIPMRFEDPL